MAIGIIKTLFYISFDPIADFILGEWMLKGDQYDKQKSVSETKLSSEDVKIPTISKAFSY